MHRHALSVIAYSLWASLALATACGSEQAAHQESDVLGANQSVSIEGIVASLQSPNEAPLTKVEILKRAVSRAQALQIRVSNFIEFFGVEIIREQNMSQQGTLSGQMNGSIDGKGRSFQIGNVLALAQGLAGLGDIPGGLAAALLSPGSSTAGLLPVGQSASNLLSGLSGWGYGSINISGHISGSIEGKFTGHGVQINNQPSLFLIVAKNSDNLEAGIERLKELEPECQAVVRANRAAVQTCGPHDTDIGRLLKNERIPSLQTLDQIERALAEFRVLVAVIDQMVSDNIADADPIFKNAESRIEKMKSWMSSKRVVLAVAAKERSYISNISFKAAKLRETVDYILEPKAGWHLFEGYSLGQGTGTYLKNSKELSTLLLRYAVQSDSNSYVVRDTVVEAIDKQRILEISQHSYGYHQVSGSWILPYVLNSLEALETMNIKKTQVVREVVQPAQYVTPTYDSFFQQDALEIRERRLGF